MEKITQYAEEIPEEVKLAVKALNDESRQAILVLLSSNVELSFSEIQKELRIDKVKLNNHLKKLFSSALIDHYYRHEVGNPNYSYYSISRLGKRVLTNLIQAFIPPSPILRIVEPRNYFDSLRAHDNSENLIRLPLDLAAGETEYTVGQADSITKTEALEAPSDNLGVYSRTEV